MATSLEYLIRVRNEGGPPLERFRDDLRRVSDESTRFGRGFSEALTPVRLLGVSIVSELNPALGAAVSQLSFAARGASSLTPVLGGLTVAIAAGAAALGVYVKRLDEAQQFQAKLGFAGRAGDLGGLQAIMREQAQAMELALTRLRASNQEITGIGSALEVVASFWLRQLNPSVEHYNELLAKARELSERLAPAQTAAAVAAAGIQIIGLQRSILEPLAGEAERVLDPQAFERRIQQLSVLIDVEEQAGLRVVRERARTRRLAAEARQAGPVELAGIEAELLEESRVVGGAAIARREALRLRGRRGRGDIAAALGLRDPDVARFAGELEAFRMPTPGEVFEIQYQGRERVLQLERDRAQVLSQISDLTAEERASTTLSVIEAERRLKLDQARGDAGKEALANLESQVQTANVLRAEFERTDPLAGLTRGFEQAAEAAASSGRVMQDFARQTAGNMQRSFSDLFFNVVTGDFKKLPDVGRQFGLAMARAVTDALAQSATAPILRLFAGGGGGARPFSAGPGGGAALDVSGASASQLSDLQARGFTVYSQGGQTLAAPAPAAPGGGLLDLFSSLFRGGGVTPVGAAGAAGLDAQAAAEGAALRTGAPAAGFGLSGGLVTGAAFAGLLALSLTTRDPATQALVGGALVGLGLGSYGGGLLAGTTAATTAGVSGAALGAAGGVLSIAVGLVLATALQDTKEEGARIEGRRVMRGRRELGNIQGAVAADVARVQAAATFDDLADAVRQAMHQAFGGPTGRGSSDSNPGYAAAIAGRLVVLPGGAYPPTMTLDELAGLLREQPETFRAVLQVGINEPSRRQFDDAFTQAVQARAAELQRIEGALVGFEEVDVQAGLTRRTLLTVRALSVVEPGGQRLFGSTLAWARAGYSESEIEVILRLIRQSNDQHDVVPDLTEEVFLQL